MRRRTLAVAALLALLILLVFGVSALADTAPTPEAKAPTAVRYTTATLNGTVNPNGGPSTTCWHFEYRPAEEVGENWQWGSGYECLSEEDSAKSEAIAVSHDLGGLQPHTKYLFRLVASNQGGETTSATEELETEAVAKPTVTIDPVTTFGSTTATFTGHVNPNAPKEAGKTDEAEQNAFRTSWHFQCTPGCPELEGQLQADDSSHEVSAEATRLIPNQPYEVTLVASNAGGQESAGPESFTTTVGAPQIDETFVSQVTISTVRLNAEVNPRGGATTVHFEYVTLAQFEEDEFAQATSTPETQSIGSDNTDHAVFADIEGLELGTIYRYRAVATNSAAPTGEAGPTMPFMTYAASEETDTCPNAARRAEQHSSYLPDCRAYEMVSPPAKAGSQIGPNSSMVRASADGNALQFASQQAFGDSTGAPFSAAYIAERSANPTPGGTGWDSHAITPPQPSGTFRTALIGPPRYEGEFSPDLSKGVFFTENAFGSSPYVEHVPNLYLRTDARSPGAGSYELVTGCPVCAETGPLPPFSEEYPYPPSEAPVWVGSTSDLSHIVFESRLALTKGTTVGPWHAYEWNEGEVRLVGLLPPNECGGEECAAPESVLGQGGHLLETDNPWRSLNVISEDGRYVSFVVPSGVCFLSRAPNQKCGQLYERVDNGQPNEETVRLNLSEKTNGKGPNGMDAAGAQPAIYEDSASNGSRIFFISQEALTNDVSEEADGWKLYMYDLTKPPTDPHNLTFISPDSNLEDGLSPAVNSVIGTGRDGHLVYFTSSGALLPGQPLFSPEASEFLYLWRDDGGDAQLELVAAGNEISQLNSQRRMLEDQTRITPNGKHLEFLARNTVSLGADCQYGPCAPDPHKVAEMYLYDAASSEAAAHLTCLSCTVTGAPSSGAPTNQWEYGAAAFPSSLHLNRPLSADASRVFFSSRNDLVASDTNGTWDPYEWERFGTGSCDVRAGCVHILSSGTSENSTIFLDASADGSDVFVATTQRLVGWDFDTGYDIYDVRLQGGFPEPVPTPAPCNGESCKGPLQTLSPATTPGSANARGPANRSQRHRKKKRRHRRKHRHHRHAHHPSGRRG